MRRIALLFTRVTDTPPLLLFAAALSVQLCIMPFHSDPSVAVVLSTVAGIWAWKSRSAQHLRPCSSPLLAHIFPPATRNDPLTGLARFGFYAFALFLVVSLFASVGHADSLRKIPRAGLWLASVVCGVFISRLAPRHQFFFLYGLAVCLCLSALSGLIYWLTGHPEGLMQDCRLKLFAGHPSRLAFLCSIGFFYLLNTLFYPLQPSSCPNSRPRSPWLIALHVAGLVALVGLILASNTRGTILCLPVGIACFFLLLEKKQWKIFLGITALLVLLCTTLLITTKQTQTTSRLIHAVTNVQNDLTFRSRLPIWEAGLQAFAKAPLTGNGLYSFLRIHAEFVEEHKERLDASLDFYENAVKHAHNIILGRMVDSGIVGTLGFLGFFLAAILRGRHVDPNYRWISSFLVYVFAAGMVEDFLWMANNSILFLFAAAILALPTAQKTSQHMALPQPQQ